MVSVITVCNSCFLSLSGFEHNVSVSELCYGSYFLVLVPVVVC